MSTARGSGNDCPVSIGGCGHGTHVAGIAVGSNANFSGVARNANLVAIKTASRIGGSITHDTRDILKGLERVLEIQDRFNIAAVNLSLGRNLYSGTCNNDSPAVTMAVENLVSSGVAVVAAAGNGAFVNGQPAYQNYTNNMSWPACISSVISVGNTVGPKIDRTIGSGFTTDQIWIDSLISSQTDLLAPGADIESSVATGPTNYGFNYGSSMSAPHVAGAIAVLKSKNPETSVNTLLNALKVTGVSITDQRPTGRHTVKRIDVGSALSLIAPDAPDVPDGELPDQCQISSPVSGRLTEGVPVCLRVTGGQAQMHFYVTQAHAGETLLIRTQHGNGEGDILHRFAGRPSSSGSNADNQSNDPGTNDRLLVANVQRGWNYIHFASPTNVAGVTMQVDYTDSLPSSDLPDQCRQSSPVSGRLTEGVPVCITQDPSGQAQMHFYVTPSRAGSTLTVQTGHGTGEGNILQRFAGRPSPSNADNMSNDPGTQDTLSIANIRSGWNYIHFYSTSTFSNVTMLVKY